MTPESRAMTPEYQTIAIVGSGAIGLYYGARLAADGLDVRFLVRSDAPHIARHGIRVESVHGDIALPHVRAAAAPAELGPVDLVVVSWKTTANGHLETVLPPLLHPATRVLTLQNGLGNCQALAAVAGADRVLGGLCFVCINRIAPGHVRHTAGGRVVIGEWQSSDHGETARAIAGRWQRAGIQATATTDLARSQWEKLVWNIPFNGLAIAEGGVTTDVILENPHTLDETRAIMLEIVAAANALGHEIDPSWVDFNIERTRPMGAYKPSSMIDFLDGREVELDAIWAEPLRRATAAGIAMPRTAALLDRIRQRIASSSI